jgi:galactokinase/galacturonokinase
MPEFEIAIIFSGLTRSLVSSDYNLRVAECKTAAWNMMAYTGMPLKSLDRTYLRDVPRETYELTKDKMPSRFARRAEHFYSEYKRVRKGVTAWETGNLALFGQLSFESCESSIRNYECGSEELIAIYNIMRQCDGIYGGRFSGAGFKGACIALVDPARKEQIREQITGEYLRMFPEYTETFEIHFCKTDEGARFV